MLLEIKEFEKAIEKSNIVNRYHFVNVFHQMTSDDNIFKGIEEGFIPYITLDVNKGNLAIICVKDEGPDIKFLNKKHMLAVKAFKYLKEVLAH